MSPQSRAIALRFGAFAAIIAVIIVLGQCQPVIEAVFAAEQKISGTKWGALLYPLLFAVCNILLLPGGILAVGAGFFFGLWWGFALTMAGNFLGTVVAFWVSRRLGREWIEQKMAGNAQLRALDRAIERRGWKIIFWSQLHPLFPTSLLNYIYGITRVRFGQCLLWVTLARVPGLFLYAYFGTLAQFGVRLLRGETRPAQVEYVLWAGGLAVTLLVSAALGIIAYRIVREVMRSSESAGSMPGRSVF
jgi:uncharacterized membrane protein YdjX (TVP38/TMEM64 family)